jgi:hypothetical protein
MNSTKRITGRPTSMTGRATMNASGKIINAGKMRKWDIDNGFKISASINRCRDGVILKLRATSFSECL